MSGHPGLTPVHPVSSYYSHPAFLPHARDIREAQAGMQVNLMRSIAMRSTSTCTSRDNNRKSRRGLNLFHPRLLSLARDMEARREEEVKMLKLCWQKELSNLTVYISFLFLAWQFHNYILHKLIVIRGGGTSGSRSTAAGGAKAKSPLRG